MENRVIIDSDEKYIYILQGGKKLVLDLSVAPEVCNLINVCASKREPIKWGNLEFINDGESVHIIHGPEFHIEIPIPVIPQVLSIIRDKASKMRQARTAKELLTDTVFLRLVGVPEQAIEHSYTIAEAIKSYSGNGLYQGSVVGTPSIVQLPERQQ